MKRNNIQTITHTLDLALEKNPNIVIYGEDVGNVGGAFRATKGLQEKYGENRVFDAPIAEASLVGAAIGMSVNGLLPIVEMQFEGFAYPAFQQIFCHIARFRNRSRGRFTCPLIIRMPVGTWGGALEHHSEAIEAMFAHAPGMIVVMPAKPSQMKGLLLAATKSPDPVIFLEGLGTYYNQYKNGNYTYNVQEEVSDDYYEIPLGKALMVKEYDQKDLPDLTIVTYGPKVYDCEKALEILEKEHNAKVELIDLQTVHPWDQEAVIASVKRTGRLLVVHEAVKSYSVAAEIISTVNEKCFEYLQCPSARVTGYDVTVPFSKGEKWFIVTPDKIVAKAITMLNYPV